MAILPRNWNWISFLVGVAVAQFLLPWILGMFNRSHKAVDK